MVIAEVSVPVVGDFALPSGEGGSIDPAQAAI
jgi:hypothetical protein